MRIFKNIIPVLLAVALMCPLLTACSDNDIKTAETIIDAVSSIVNSEATEEKHEESTDTKNEDDVEHQETAYYFRNDKLLNQHYEKHGIEMGFKSAQEYEMAASAVINNPDALSKTEKEDGDYVFYVENTNEFVILSKDGYIRTYFLPDAGKRYYDKQ